MKVECQNCRMIRAVKEDRIVTSQNSIDLSCPTCRFSMVLHLQSDLSRSDSSSELRDLSGDQLAGDLPAKDAGNQRGITALKAKILRNLIDLPPMPHIILKAREILSNPDCDAENELACLIHLADVLAKSSGFAAGQSATLDGIAPEILQFLHIRTQDLDVVAAAVRDDLQKIKEELREG